VAMEIGANDLGDAVPLVRRSGVAAALHSETAL
jgi:hypothetical protein